MMPKTAAAIIKELDLAPHPEGGWYREVYRSATPVSGPNGTRTALTTIYFLLERDQLSRWHVVGADEVWHFYEGAPLELFAYDPASRHLTRSVLGPLGSAGVSVAIVPAGIWQAARSLADHSLTGCTVGPGFEFADFRFVSSLPDHAGHFAAALHGLRDLL
jgi:predicted cupin superfamily sugar epimerase